MESWFCHKLRLYHNRWTTNSLYYEDINIKRGFTFGGVYVPCIYSRAWWELPKAIQVCCVPCLLSTMNSVYLLILPQQIKAKLRGFIFLNTYIIITVSWQVATHELLNRQQSVSLPSLRKDIQILNWTRGTHEDPQYLCRHQKRWTTITDWSQWWLSGTG